LDDKKFKKKKKSKKVSPFKTNGVGTTVAASSTSSLLGNHLRELEEITTHRARPSNDFIRTTMKYEASGGLLSSPLETKGRNSPLKNSSRKIKAVSNSPLRSSKSSPGLAVNGSRTKNSFEWTPDASFTLDNISTVSKPDEVKAYQAVQRQLLLKYIMSPSCGLFRQRQADIDMPVDDINHMLELGGAETLVVHLKFLDTQRMRFSGFSKMVDAVNESVFFRLELLFCLSNPANTLLSEQMKNYLNLAAVNSLVDEGGAAYHTMTILNDLVEQKRHFDQFKFLILAVRKCFVEMQKTGPLPVTGPTKTAPDVTRKEPDKAVPPTAERKKKTTKKVRKEEAKAVQQKSQKCSDSSDEDGDGVSALPRPRAPLLGALSRQNSLQNIIKASKGKDHSLAQTNSSKMQHPGFEDTVNHVALNHEESDPSSDDGDVFISPLLNMPSSSRSSSTVPTRVGSRISQMSQRDQGHRATTAEGRKVSSANPSVTSLTTTAVMSTPEIMLIVNLSAPNCALFKPGAGNTLIGSSEIRWLIENGGGLSATMMTLRLFEQDRIQFENFDSLCKAVRHSRMESFEHKQEILDYLRHPNCKVLSVASEDSGIRSFSAKGKSKVPLHLQQQPEMDKGRGVTMIDMTRLYEETGAGRNTIHHLKELNDAGECFHDLDPLILAVKSVHSKFLINLQEDRKLLEAHLSGPRCNLFYDEITISSHHLTLLLNIGRTGPATLMMLENLDHQGKRYLSISELIDDLSAASGQTQALQEAILAFLMSPNCGILLDSKRDGNRITFRDVAELYERAKVGPETIVHLWIFNASGLQFADIEALSSAVKAAHIQSLETRFETFMIIAHLLGPTCNLLPADFHGNMADLERMVEMSSGAAQTLQKLEKLESNGSSFQNLEQLINAVHEIENEQTQRRNKLLLFLKGESEHSCDLFQNPSTKQQLTANDVDSLMEFDKYTPEALLDELYSLSVSKFTFPSFEELKGRIREDYLTFLVTLRDEKDMIFSHLTHEKCGLLTDALKKSFTDHLVERLFTVVPNGPALLYHLLLLENEGGAFASVSDLCVQLRKQLANFGADDVLQFLVEPTTKILRPNGTEEVGLSVGDIALLLQNLSMFRTVSSLTATRVMLQLWIFRFCDVRLSSLQELTLRLRAKWGDYNDRKKEERLMVCAYLFSNRCSLFMDGGDRQIGTIMDIEQLIEAGHGQSAVGTYNILEYFSDTGEVFENVSSLSVATREAAFASIMQKHDLGDYLNSNRLRLLPNSKSAFSESMVETVWKHGRAGPNTQKVLSALPTGTVFSSFDDMIQCVKRMHFEDVKEQEKRMKYMAMIQKSEVRKRSIVEIAEVVGGEDDDEHTLAVLRFLKSKSCNLLPPKVKGSLSIDEVDDIVDGAGTAQQALQELTFLNASNKTYDHLTSLSEEVQRLHLLGVRQKRALYKYLNDDPNGKRLVTQRKVRRRSIVTGVAANKTTCIDRKTVSRLYEVGGVHTMFLLNQMSTEGQTFTSVQALEQGIQGKLAEFMTRTSTDRLETILSSLMQDTLIDMSAKCDSRVSAVYRHQTRVSDSKFS